MLWSNNPEIMRAVQPERIRQAHEGRTTRKPDLKLVAMEAEAEATTVG